MSTYAVKVGETITDVVVNATGNLDNWDVILTANGFEDWTPQLVAGQLVQIPDDLVVVDQNAQRQLATYPICNSAVSNILDQIDQIVGLLTDNWILATGFWNDNALWIDTKTWID